MTKYGIAIKKIRALRLMSQRDLAEKVGLDVSYISFIETGRRKPSLKALESIASALEIPFYLLTVLASKKADLPGIDKTRLTNHLLALLLDSQ